MAKPLDSMVKDQVLNDLRNSDFSVKEIASFNSVSESTVRRINDKEGDLMSKRDEIINRRQKAIEYILNCDNAKKSYSKPKKVGTLGSMALIGILGFIGGCTYRLTCEDKIEPIAAKIWERGSAYVSETIDSVFEKDNGPVFNPNLKLRPAKDNHGHKNILDAGIFGSYIVKQKDTLTKISKSYGISIEDIMDVNPSIKDRNNIFLGQEIKIPSSNIDMRSGSNGDHRINDANLKINDDNYRINGNLNKVNDVKRQGFLAAPKYQGPDRKHLVTKISGADRHYGGANKGIDKIVLHITDSEGKSAENWFTLPNKMIPKGQAASAHYIVEKDGTIIQIVPENIVAYHCRGENQGSIGIEFVGKLYDTNKQTYTKEQVASGIRLVSYLQKKYGVSDNEVYGHRKFSAKECPGKKNLEVMKAELRKYLP